MSVTSGFFNSLSGDRKYDAIQISSMFDGLITDGIYNGFLKAFMVTASEPASMVVTVGEGRAWFNHTWTLNDAPLPLTIEASDVVLNRIDTVVIDVDSTDTTRACTIKVVKGTASSQAAPPTLVNAEMHHQYPLCDISIPAAAKTITQAQIKNRRGTSDCPFVATLMKSVSVDDLLAQWEAQWDEWMQSRMTAMDQWTNEQKEAFNAWFQSVQDILDSNAAGNLLNRINHRTGVNATATYDAGVVKIVAPDDAGEVLTFVAPSDFLASDTYTVNAQTVTLTDLNGEAVDDAWKKDSIVTISVNGGKAFFKTGGGGKNDTLPPLLGNMTVEVSEGSSEDTYTIKMDKLVLDKTTKMVAGAQLEWGEEMPAKPGKGANIKKWSREEIVTTGKPYDGLYLGDVTASDAVNEVILWLPENEGGKIKLVPFIILSTDYLGGVYVMRKHTSKDFYGLVRNQNGSYFGGGADVWITNTYLNSVLGKNVSSALLDCEITTAGVKQTRKCWIPSMPEVGSNNYPGDGEKMPYFASDQRRIAYDEDTGTPHVSGYWTRTQASSTHNFSIGSTGKATQTIVTNFTCYRPSFVLPKDFKIQQRPDGSYTVWNEQGLMKLEDIEASSTLVKTSAHYFENGKVVDAIYISDHYNEFDVGVILREKCILGVGNNIQYGDGITNYAASVINRVMQSYKTAQLSQTMRSFMKDVTVKSRDANGNYSSLSTSIAVPNVQELNLVSGWGTGESFSYFSSNDRRKANRDDGYGGRYRTRDLSDYKNSYYVDGSSGTLSTVNLGALYDGRPMLFLDKKIPIRQLADGSYDLVPDDPSLSPKQVSERAATTVIQLKDVTPSTTNNKVIVKIPETGGEKDYIALRQNYDGTSDGYALMRDACAQNLVFNSTPVGGRTPYSNSALDNAAIAFESQLSDAVKPYLVEGSVRLGNAGTVIIKRKIFVASQSELGEKYPMVYSEGEAFERFVGSGNSGNATNRLSNPAASYWTRSTSGDYANSNYTVYINALGAPSGSVQTSVTPALRPIILLSGEAYVTDNGDGTYTFVGDKPADDSPAITHTYTFVGDKPADDSPAITHTVTVPHGQKVVFRQFTQNDKKQFQTMLVGGVYPPLGDLTPPFALPEFTGNHSIFGDKTAGRIELYESGTLTLSPGTYDFFLVGGGGAGYRGRYSEYSDSTGGGGAGGKTFTQKAVTVPKLTVCPALVGAGGSLSGITVNDSNFSAQAGGGANRSKGGSGGSGGGGGGEERGNVHGGSGGSDGSNGADGYSKTEYHKGGTGQGTTTKSFGEVGGTLYAGGAGGGACSGMGAGAAGGTGGGGNGGNGSSSSGPGTAGTANTGGGGGGGGDRYNSPGGAGGSGIIIVRWNNAV